MNTIRTRGGWRESADLLLTAAAVSILLVIAMPGRFGWWPLLCVALVPLLSICARRGGRVGLSAGLLTGFFTHIGLLYWIVIVLGRYGGLPPLISLPAMLGLALYMGLYVAVFAGVAGMVLGGGRPGTVAVLFGMPALWTGLEWLRGELFSGFPWMDLGYGLASRPLLIQVADLGGHHLVGFLLVMVNGLIFLAVNWFRRSREGTGHAGTMGILAALIMLTLAAGYSLVRFDRVEAETGQAPSLRAGVAQGNIPQDEKWTPGRKESTLDVYRRLSDTAVEKGAGLVVWPETTLPFFPGNDPLFAKVTGWAAERHAWLLTGAPFFIIGEDLEKPFTRSVSYYNSALLIDPAGTVRGRYDKRHLVPFGEYVPLRRWLFFLEPLVESVGNFTPGGSAAPLEMNGIRIGVLICYESIFPVLAREEVKAGADLLVNLTNDAWYGRSSAPFQSFAMSVFRAVETRRSLVRAANTGVSGFVDPLGRVSGRTSIFTEQAVTADLPLLHGETVFVRFGFLFGPLCLAAAVVMTLVGRKTEPRDRTPHFFS